MTRDEIKQERREQLRPMVESGMSRSDIANRLGVTPQAVSAMLRSLGLSEVQAAIKRESARAAEAATRSERERQCQAKHGCDLDTLQALRANGATAAFIRQRQNARSRGIGWRLTLGDWWRIWDESGRWPERSKFKGGYVMGRFGDQGDYEVGNVSVVTHSENAKVAQSHARGPQGGVYLSVPGLAKPWTAYKNKRCLGYFSTREEAIAFRDCA